MIIDNAFYENEKITLRKMEDSDKELFLEINRLMPLVTKIENVKEYEDILWEGYRKPTTSAYFILDNHTHTVLGICQLDHIDTKTPHIGIDILEKYRQQGYGYEAVRLFIQNVHLICEADYFIWRCFQDNLGSQCLAKKLGGILINKMPGFPEHIIQIAKEKGIFSSEEEIPVLYEYKIPKEPV